MSSAWAALDQELEKLNQVEFKIAHPCPECGKDLARRQGEKKSKVKGVKPRKYDFYSCTGYPKCDKKFNTGPEGKPILTE